MGIDVIEQGKPGDPDIIHWEDMNDGPVIELASPLPALRDQFAMAALTGLLASPHEIMRPEVAAHCAYRHADEMMKAREGGE